MKTKIHDAGYSLIAALLTGGGGGKVDRMLVEIDTQKTAGTFRMPDGNGKAVLVPAAAATDGAAAVFTGLVRAADFPGAASGGKITRATVLSGTSPVATAVMDPPVELADGAYVSVVVRLEIGG